MKVVLVQNVEKFGKKGEVIEVSPGYGVNYLIPRGLAVKATPEAIQTAKMIAIKKKEKKEQIEEKVASLGKKIDRKTFQIKVKASKSGRLYASLTKAEVTDSLKKQWGLEGTGSEIFVDLAQPIRDAGRYPLTVSVSSGGEKKDHEIILSVIAE